MMQICGQRIFATGLRRQAGRALLLAQIGLCAAVVNAQGSGGGEVRRDSSLQQELVSVPGRQPEPIENDPRPLVQEESELKALAEAIIKGPLFSPEEITHVPRYKYEKKDKPETESPAWLKALSRFFRGLGEWTRVLVWVGGAILILALLFGLHYWWRLSAPSRVRARITLPTQVGGLDIRPESLPDDVAAAARAAWERGDRVQALSLLYRGALSALVVRFGAPIKASSTEQECVRAARKSMVAAAADYFARLTQAWLLAIYAQRWPASEAVLNLCSEYSQHFAVMPAASASRTSSAQGDGA